MLKCLVLHFYLTNIYYFFVADLLKMRNYKRKTPKTTDNQIKLAVQAIRDTGISVRTAASAFNVNRETLRRHLGQLKSSDTDINTATLERSFNFKTVFTAEQEATLKDYLVECSVLGHGLSRKQCRQAAYDLAMKNKIPMPNSWSKYEIAGEDWVKGFLKRNPDLALRKGEACSLARAVCFNKNTVNTFFNNLEKVYKRVPNLVIENKRIYNLDECSTTTVQTPRKVISPKGSKQVYVNTSTERGTLVTTCAIICASGQMLPPAMIFPRVKYVPKMLNNCYPGTLGLVNPSGWMTSALFVKVLEHFIKCTQSTKENPTVLILDNHESHVTLEAVELARQFGVILLTLPPHTSHKLQALDVGIFSPFNRHYDSAMCGWMMKHPGQHVTIYEIAGLVGEALPAACTPQNIQSAFKATGIFPFNRNIFPGKPTSNKLAFTTGIS